MSDLKDLLPSIQVYPFPELRNVDSRFCEARVECPKRLAEDDFYERSKTRRFESVYCKGNLPAEYEYTGGLRAALTGKGHTHETPCAGIVEEHFHIQCQCCGYHFYLSLPDKYDKESLAKVVDLG